MSVETPYLFPADEIKPVITVRHMIDCAKREIVQRRNVYPHLVMDGRMTQDKANFEILCMEEILKHLQEFSREQENQTSNQG